MAASTRIAVALLVTLLTLVASACSTKRTALVAPPTSAPIRHVLFNGVRVIIEEHRTSDVVAVQLWVKAGGRDEVANELGLAHYLEHMLFKGTPTRPGRLIDREVEGTGGRMNAGTSLDFTYYHMVLPASRAVAGVEILADIGVNASLDEPLLEAEKRVVLEEIRLGEDSPMRFLFKKTYESVFDGHPYGRPVIGTPELIRALTREQLVRFYRRLYSPENFTLVVVGAVNPDQIRDVATRAFSRLPRGGTARLPAPPIADLKPRAVALPRPGTQAYLTMAWMAPKLDHAIVRYTRRRGVTSIPSGTSRSRWSRAGPDEISAARGWPARSRAHRGDVRADGQRQPLHAAQRAAAPRARRFVGGRRGRVAPVPCRIALRDTGDGRDHELPPAHDGPGHRALHGNPSRRRGRAPGR